jgi:cation/acetate symporter
MIDPKADAKRRLITSRVLLLFVAVVAAYVAGTLGADILFLVSWAFSIAAAGLFAGIVFGIWWKKTTNAGGIAGVIAGYGVCMVVLVTTEFYGKDVLALLGPDLVTMVKVRGRDVAYIFGINNISCGIFGIPLAFLVTWLVSLVTKAPSTEMQEFVESLRVPIGRVKLARTQDAIVE